MPLENRVGFALPAARMALVQGQSVRLVWQYVEKQRKFDVLTGRNCNDQDGVRFGKPWILASRFQRKAAGTFVQFGRSYLVLQALSDAGPCFVKVNAGGDAAAPQYLCDFVQREALKIPQHECHALFR